MKTNQGVEKNAIQTAANACFKSCQKLAAQIEQVKRSLWADLVGTLDVPEKLFRLALGEAEALAWQTDYPHLVFPALATEKVQEVAAWNTRQQFLHHNQSVHAMSI